VCALSCEERYGPIGKDFIHVHHLKPLSTLRQAPASIQCRVLFLSAPTVMQCCTPASHRYQSKS
jgi:hypothetical protein